MSEKANGQGRAVAGVRERHGFYFKSPAGVESSRGSSLRTTRYWVSPVVVYAGWGRKAWRSAGRFPSQYITMLILPPGGYCWFVDRNGPRGPRKG
jgi:hypothetical protein